MSVWLTACTDVSVCPDTEHPHSTDLTLTFEWDPRHTDRPDTMFVALYKIINTEHSVISIPMPDAGSGTPKAGDGEDNTPVLPYTRKIPGGEYTMLAFSKNSATLDFINLDRFEQDKTVSLKEIKIRVKEAKASEIPELKEAGWIDLNPTTSYIINTGQLYTDIESKRNLLTGTATHVQFRPQPITQKIKINFRLIVREGMTIQKIIAELSGVARQVELASRHIDRSSTHRMVFCPQVVTQQDSILTCEGEVNVLGLFPSENASFISGPGILHLAVKVLSGNVPQTFHYGINLKSTITKAALLQMADDDENVQLSANKPGATLVIEQLLQLQSKGNKPGENTGIDSWFDSDTKVDVEI